MFLKKLVLNDVCGIEHADLSLLGDDLQPRKWTIVVGENGSGKSTLLRAAGLVLAGSEALPSLIKDPGAWVREGAETCRIDAVVATKEGEERKLSLVIKQADTLSTLLRRTHRSLQPLDDAIAHSSRNYFTAGYGASRRMAKQEVSSHRSSEMPPRAASLATLFDPTATLNPIESWAMDLDYRRGKVGMNLVKQAMHHLLRGVDFVRIDKERAELLFKTPDGIVPLARLSEGYQTTAAWCGDLLYRITTAFNNYKNPLSTRGLLLLDEIDLHLHPIWQRELMSYLTENLSNLQIIATSHSPMTVQQAGPGEVFVMRRPEPADPPELTQFDASPRGLMLPQLLEPLFGIKTVDSREVERKKQEYRDLRDRDKRTTTETRRLIKLAKEIESKPDYWEAVRSLAEPTSSTTRSERSSTNQKRSAKSKSIKKRVAAKGPKKKATKKKTKKKAAKKPAKKPKRMKK